jgi:hypothetical protein
VVKNRLLPVQLDSNISNLEMIAKNDPAQRHSIISKSIMGIMRVIGVMGDMGQERIVKNAMLNDTLKSPSALWEL